MTSEAQLQYPFKLRIKYVKSIILLQNTRSVQEMESLALFAHEKCI